MLTTDSVTFDTTELHIHTEGGERRIWSTSEGHMIAVEAVPGPSPILALAREESAATKFRQWVAGSGNALIEFTRVEGDGWIAVRTIIKSSAPPPNDRGRSYSGSLMVPFRDGSILFRTAACEANSSGVRESEVFSSLNAAGTLGKASSPGRIAPDGTVWHGYHECTGWLSAPEDPAPPHLARCVADDAIYDASFPDHPLTRVRRLLDQIQRSIGVLPGDEPVTSFTPEPQRSWWQRLWGG